MPQHSASSSTNVPKGQILTQPHAALGMPTLAGWVQDPLIYLLESAAKLSLGMGDEAVGPSSAARSGGG